MNDLAETVHARLIALGRPAGLQFMEHIYVVPVANADNFRPQQPRGNPFWLDTHRRIVSFPRAGHRIVQNIADVADIETAARQQSGRNGGRVPLAQQDGRQLTRASSARRINNTPWQ